MPDLGKSIAAQRCSKRPAFFYALALARARYIDQRMLTAMPLRIYERAGAQESKPWQRVKK